MAAPPFDPYHKWLGIPPEEQPPHHYRLLGLALFESDPDVVDTAAEQRMSYLRTCATGSHVADSQRLLNEVSAARRCLLDRNRKADYDRKLKAAGIGAAAEVPLPVETAPTTAEPFAPTPIAAAPAPPLPRVSGRVRRSSRKSSPWPMLIAFSVGLAALGGFLFYFVPRFLEPKPAAEVAANAEPIDRHTGTEKPHHVPLAPTKKTPGQGKGGTVTDPPPLRIGPRGLVEERDPTRRKEPRRPRNEFDGPLVPEAGSEPPTQPVSTDSPGTTAKKRGAVPAGADLAAAEEQVRAIYGGDIDKARRPDEKAALAKRLVEESSKTFGDEATGALYVILRDARTLAVEGGDVPTALAAIAGLARRFEIDVLPMKVEAVRAAAPKARDSVTESLAFAEAALLLAEECGAADDYEAAGSLLLLATGAARRIDQKDFTDRIARVRTGLAEQKLDHEAYVAARAVLDKLPDDPQALFTAGSFLCFRRHDWPAGLALLEKSGDALLAEAVRLDLQGAVFAPEQATIGDAWWDWVESKKTKPVLPFRAAAHYWYRKAQPTLAGLDRAKVDKRLQDIGTPERPRLDAPPAVGAGVGAAGGAGTFILPGTAIGSWTNLFDGSYLTNWKARNSPGVAGWMVVGGVSLDPADPRQFSVEDGRGILVNGRRGREFDLACVEVFGDLHVQCDFCIAGNSSPGILLQGRYEIALSDSLTRPQLTTRSAGGIPGGTDPAFEGHAPLTNAARAPGEWQTLEIVFRAPRFDQGDVRTQPARFVRVVLNGEVVQDNLDVSQPTPAAVYADEAETGPLVLRGGWGPIAFRNLRVRKLRLD